MNRIHNSRISDIFRKHISKMLAGALLLSFGAPQTLLAHDVIDHSTPHFLWSAGFDLKHARTHNKIRLLELNTNEIIANTSERKSHLNPAIFGQLEFGMHWGFAISLKGVATFENAEFSAEDDSDFTAILRDKTRLDRSLDALVIARWGPIKTIHLKPYFGVGLSKLRFSTDVKVSLEYEGTSEVLLESKEKFTTKGIKYIAGFEWTPGSKYPFLKRHADIHLEYYTVTYDGTQLGSAQNFGILMEDIRQTGLSISVNYRF